MDSILGTLGGDTYESRYRHICSELQTSGEKPYGAVLWITGA